MELGLKKFKLKIVFYSNDKPGFLPRFIMASTVLMGVLVFIYLNRYCHSVSEENKSWSPLHPEHQTRSPFGAFLVEVQAVMLRIMILIGRAYIYLKSYFGDLLLWLLEGNAAAIRGFQWCFNCEKKVIYYLIIQNLTYGQNILLFQGKRQLKNMFPIYKNFRKGVGLNQILIFVILYVFLSLCTVRIVIIINSF